DHRIYAAVYDRLNRPVEEAGLRQRRRRLLAGATGRVLEVGGGTGANLPHYVNADSVTILEPDGAMRRRLLAHVDSEGVEVHPVGVEAADFPPASFNTVVCTLVLCSVPDLVGSLRRMREWLVPDGRLLFLEHVRAAGTRGHVQHLVTPVWSRLVPGCHLDRDPVAAMRAAGFAVTDCERFSLPLGNALIGAAVQG